MSSRRLSMICLLTLLLLGAAGCKEKIPKLTPKECDTFCKRLVPCFAQRMGNFSMTEKQDIKECIDNCTSQEGRKHGPILRAMKRCGHIKVRPKNTEDCQKLRSCFDKSLH